LTGKARFVNTWRRKV